MRLLPPLTNEQCGKHYTFLLVPLYNFAHKPFAKKTVSRKKKEKKTNNKVINNSALFSRMPFAQHNHGFGHFFSATSSSRRESMVGGALTRASAFRVGLGVSGATIVSGSYVCPSHLWISRVLTSSSSSGISSLFCCATQCM
jgi:hypothetical protein